jgi:hypothetical protein
MTILEFLTRVIIVFGVVFASLIAFVFTKPGAYIINKLDDLYRKFRMSRIVQCYVCGAKLKRIATRKHVALSNAHVCFVCDDYMINFRKNDDDEESMIQYARRVFPGPVTQEFIDALIGSDANPELIAALQKERDDKK